MLLMNFERNFDQEYDEIFKQVVRMADQLKVKLNIVKVAKKWIRQDNVSASLPKKYYKRALVTPIIDSFISEMTSRFNKFNCKADKLLILAPSVLYSEKRRRNVDISPILEEYEEDLISRDVVDETFLPWKRKCLTVASKYRTNTLTKTIKK